MKFKMLTSMMQFNVSRFLHTSCILRSVDKGLLAKLRKKTGYSIANCRKALDKHENDINKAEEWLIKEAQSEGWAKVASLSERATTQGLLGVHVIGNQGAIVEVNCETDFVARNDTFINFIKDASKTCLFHNTSTSDTLFNKNFLKEDEIKNLTDEGGKRLSDTLALTVGSMKENMKLRRAVKVTCGDGIDLVGLTHPQSSSLTGKYAALLALKNPNNNLDIAKKLCLHVIGMNPLAIGTSEDLKTALAEVVDDTETQNIDDSSGEESVKDTSKVNKIMYYQEFIGDQNVNVAQVLNEHNIEIIDFVRLNCGEEME